MSAGDLLSRWEGVRARGPGSWSARCPAHDDKSPSLSVRETDDGTVLVHCFGGCSVHEICDAVGLELSDLFPPRPETHYGIPRRKPRVDGWQVIEVLQHRLTVLRVAAAGLARGERLSDPDLATVREALGHVGQIIQEART